MVNVAAVQLFNASFVLSNLPRASITRWLHAARLPFLNYLWKERWKISPLNVCKSKVTKTVTIVNLNSLRKYTDKD